MSKRMTVVFKDENVYKHLKVEAAKRDINASEIVSEAIVEWIENREDVELAPLIKESQEEVNKSGTKSWDRVKGDSNPIRRIRY